MSVAKFSTFDISRQIFYRSTLSYALVNLKPIVKYHVLVIPKRVVSRLHELSPAEISDLFISASHIGRVLEKEAGAKSLTVAVQDGEWAGQSVPHCHVHVLPRVPGDFKPLDKIYDE